tara:strand:- start:2681 stop:3499 length:819 start_codon:yes stop_codon:yes gene_type:complete
LLRSSADVSQSAQEFFDRYEAFVVGDGGAITDAGETLAAIQWAKDRGVLGRSRAVSAAWGLNVSGGAVSKMYALDGSVFLSQNGTHTLDTTTRSFPVVLFGPPPGSFPGRFVQADAQRNVTGEKIILGLAVRNNSEDFWCGVDSGSGGFSALAARKADTGIHRVITRSEASTEVGIPNSEVTPSGGAGVFIDSGIGSLTQYLNGVGGFRQVPPPGVSLIDYSSYPSSVAYVGAPPYPSSAGTNGSEFVEFWLIDGADEHVAQELSVRFAEKY